VNTLIFVVSSKANELVPKKLSFLCTFSEEWFAKHHFHIIVTIKVRKSDKALIFR